MEAWPCLDIGEIPLHGTIVLGGKLRDYLVQLLPFLCEEMETQRCGITSPRSHSWNTLLLTDGCALSCAHCSCHLDDASREASRELTHVATSNIPGGHKTFILRPMTPSSVIYF